MAELGPEDLVAPAEGGRIIEAVGDREQGARSSRPVVYQAVRGDGSTVFLEVATSQLGTGSARPLSPS